MADNGIYTPSPKIVTVTVYRDWEGDIHAATAPRHLVDGEFLRTEEARVTGRGNLLANGIERWHMVELRDGSEHAVITEGS